MFDVGIIGGADGPTAVLVASSAPTWLFLAGIGVAVIVIVALIAALKNRK